MDWSRLISQNKRRAAALFSRAHVSLPPYEGSLSVLTSDAPISLPSTSIAPVPVIDTRPARAKERVQTVLPAPKPHRQWYNYQTIAGHAAWVRAVAVDPSNAFFVTGSSDRLLKFWDLATGRLNVTLTGHVGGIRDVALSNRSPYLFSCCEAKQILCWDLTRNAVVRDFHGHLSGVYCLALHPSLDLLASGGRDSVARIWDIRTRRAEIVLEGHDRLLFDLLLQEAQPNVVTGSGDATVRTWDLRTGGCSAVLTRHAKAVRALVAHPTEWGFASASQDAVLQWGGEDAVLVKRFEGTEAIVNAMAINQDGVLVAAGDDGCLQLWDWGSGQGFQTLHTLAQPGSLPSECGIFDCAFDVTGTRLITCEVDKTVKLWREVKEDGQPY
jgi:pleiotropic regulator 1